jgi:very-short-patch-repair endonuclease
MLWSALRRNALLGFRFRRQQPLGHYIVDFYCHAAKLVVEADGGVHATQPGYDGLRDETLRRRGLQVLRFSNEEILGSLDSVMHKIAAVLGPLPSPPRRSRRSLRGGSAGGDDASAEGLLAR